MRITFILVSFLLMFSSIACAYERHELKLFEKDGRWEYYVPIYSSKYVDISDSFSDDNSALEYDIITSDGISIDIWDRYLTTMHDGKIYYKKIFTQKKGGGKTSMESYYTNSWIPMDFSSVLWRKIESDIEESQRES